MSPNLQHRDSDDAIRELMRRAVDAAPATPSFEDAMRRGRELAVPNAAIVATSPQDRRSPGKFIASVLLVLGLTGGGYLAYAKYVGPDGYDSPTEAADALIDALSEGDLLRASRTLVPFERDHMAERLRAALGVAQKNGVLADNDLSKARNIGLTASGLELSEHSMATGYTRVEADRGELRLSIDAALLGGPMRSNSSNFGSTTADLIDVATPRNPDTGAPMGRPGLVAVETNGTWHISLSYSVFETIRISKGDPLPNFGPLAAPEGFDTPEQAADALTNSLYGLATPEKARQLIDPVSGEALLRYLPVVIKEKSAAAATNYELAGPSLRNAKWSLDGTGIWRTASLLSGETRGSDNDGNPVYLAASTDSCDSTRPTQACLSLATIPSVALVERDGRWYVDPIETAGRFLSEMIVGRAGAAGPPVDPERVVIPATTVEIPAVSSAD